jgi:hypothetical protein
VKTLLVFYGTRTPVTVLDLPSITPNKLHAFHLLHIYTMLLLHASVCLTPFSGRNVCVMYSKPHAFMQLLSMIQWLRHELKKVQHFLVCNTFTMVKITCYTTILYVAKHKNVKNRRLKSSIYTAYTCV